MLPTGGVLTSSADHQNCKIYHGKKHQCETFVMSEISLYTSMQSFWAKTYCIEVVRRLKRRCMSDHRARLRVMLTCPFHLLLECQCWCIACIEDCKVHWQVILCFGRQSRKATLHIVLFRNKPIIAEAIAWAGVCLSCSIIQQKLMACWQCSWLSLMLYGGSDIRCIIQKPDPTHHECLAHAAVAPQA